MALIPLVFVFTHCKEKASEPTVGGDKSQVTGASVSGGKSVDATKVMIDPKKLPWEKGIDSAIQGIIGKKTAELTQSDLAAVTKLDVSGKGIQSLVGLEKLENLEELTAGPRPPNPTTAGSDTASCALPPLIWTRAASPERGKW